MTSQAPRLGAVGGQAVIEGVMMRAQAAFVVAVREPGGSLLVRERAVAALRERFAPLGWPLLRGVVTLCETVAQGLAALSFSAAVAEGRGTEVDAPMPSRGSTALSLVVSLGLGLALFVGAPHGLAILVGRVGGFGLDSLWFHATAGALKLAIFVTYLGLLSLLPDVRRLFQYHGAEHKVIAAHEAGLPLTVDAARRMTTFHARCGTSFVLVVALASIVVFALVVPALGLGDGPRAHLVALAVKIPLLLPVSGLAYELNRFAAAHLDRRWVRWLVTPGFWLQRLTTREPSDEMLEVALASLRAALALAPRAITASSPWSVASYRSYAELSARLA